MRVSHENILIPTLQVRERCIVYYQSNEFRSVKKEADFKKPAYSSTVTKGVQGRIGRAVDIFLQTTETRRIFNTVTQRDMNFRLGFVTLTISDYCDWKADKCYTNLLKPFLRVMKDKHGVEKYLWKYELQERGNVHYHVTIDQFVAHDAIRGTWNKVQKKNGLTNVYAEKYGHFNPNSTDVHKVWKIQNIAAYLGKYLSKGNSKVWKSHDGFQQMYFERDTKGKVWDCSSDLKRKRFSVVATSENSSRVDWLVQRGEVEIINLENCTILKCNDPKKILTESQKIDYEVWKYV